MNKNVARLTDAIDAICCLRFLRRIPMAFEMDDVVCGGDGKADARGERREDANAKTVRALKRFDHAEAGAVHPRGEEQHRETLAAALRVQTTPARRSPGLPPCIRPDQ